ncbi:MAG TPA: hypothetical protein VHY08_14650, partial [Bacillota bacterium]|nr:hypothetical protein [Bacillota bacterium]
IYARIRLSRNGPCLPRREGYLEIWIKGAKFRIRDATGRYLDEILGDIGAGQGLGQAPRTLEEIMDISHRVFHETKPVVTELSGDTATNWGLVCEPGQAPWTIEAGKIVSVARQIFTDGLEKQLEPVKTVTRFGRVCVDYHGFITGEEGGAPYKSEFTRIVSPPFVFLNEVRDAENSDYYYIREAVDFEVDKVTDAEVEPQGTDYTTVQPS